jgi:hypothetical protein
VKISKVRLDAGTWTSTGYNMTFNFTGLLHGPHSVSVNVTDWAGRSTVQNVSFVVDTQPPLLIVSEPSEGDVIETEDVQVEWSATDSESGVVRYEVAVDGGAFENYGTMTSAELKNLENGPHDVVVRATDGVGNQKDVTIGFTVDVSDTGGGGMGSLVAIVIVAVVAIIAVAAVLMRRRGRVPRTEVGKEPPKKG